MTVGGAIACDVHGKNHHRRGTLRRHVVSARPGHPRRRRPHRISPTDDPDLFWATVGGMGLTGVDRCAPPCAPIPVETGWRPRRHRAVRRPRRADGARCARPTTTWTYSVAWIDTVAARPGPRAVGADPRRARPAGRARRPPRPHAAPAAGRPATRRAPPWCSRRAGVARLGPCLQRALVPQGAPPPRAASCRRSPRSSTRSTGSATGTGSTARAGFVQYQFVVPDGAEDVVRDAVDGWPRAATRRSSPCSSGSARRTPACCPSRSPAGPSRSTSRPGRGSPRCSTTSTRVVAEAGGRVYLAKDSRLSARTFAAMYPRADEFARRARPGGPGAVSSPPTWPDVSGCDPGDGSMIDALGRPQSLLLLGGTSDIALAVARAWSDAAPGVTVAARPGRPPRRRGRRTAAPTASRSRCVDFDAEAPTPTRP